MHTTNRRHFLRTVAGAAGAMTIAGSFNPLNAQARREVSIGGRRIKVIDILKSQLLTVDLVLNASFLSDADKTAILSGNLAKLLKIS